ncbi:MAG: hotdog domain-containing protein, partial [Campylobacterota bacterium]|nr:hotdog domain-containing protein [Campylobacterota bacterium]
GIVPLEEDKSGFVVRNIKADFLSTSTLGDILTVKSKVLKIKNSSLVLLQEIWREEIKIFSMNILLVYISNGKPSRTPEKYKNIFNNFN